MEFDACSSRQATRYLATSAHSATVGGEKGGDDGEKEVIDVSAKVRKLATRSLG